MYTFSTLDDNIATNGTVLTGINNYGEIVGYYNDTGNIFSFLDHGGYFEDLNATPGPPAVTTELLAISNTGGSLYGQGIQNFGRPVGFLDYSSGGSTWGAVFANTPTGGPWYSYEYSVNNFTNFLDPTTYTGINDSGEIVGYAEQQGTYDGEVVPPGFSNYSSFPLTTSTSSGEQPFLIIDPFAGTNGGQGTFPSGINDAGTVVGTYIDSADLSHGFIEYVYNGIFGAPIDVPGAQYGTTNVTGINNNNEIVGYFTENSTKAVNSFVAEPAGPNAWTYYIFADPSAAAHTYAQAINDSGEIVGDYWDLNLNIEGFMASDQPPSMMMRNINSGAFEIYNVSNNRLGSPAALRTVGLDWQVAGYGDFSGKTNESGMLLQNTDTGAFEIYNLSDNKLIGPVALNSLNMLGLDWQAAGVGDFSGNVDESDVLMRNTDTGAFEIYDINDDKLTGQHALRPASLDWQVAGVGDFSGNANETDMLLRNSDTGAFDIYNISDNKLTGIAALKMIGLDWQVAGVGDFSSIANQTDLLLRNSDTGTFEILDVSDDKVVAHASLGQIGLSWSVAGFSDFGDHPSETDMLLRNNDIGAFQVWDIADNRLVSTESLGRVGTQWQFSGLPSEPAIGPSTTFQLSGSAVSAYMPPMPMPHNN